MVSLGVVEERLICCQRASGSTMLDAKLLQTPAVIIDNGSGSCKAGIAGEDEPRSVVMSVVGHLKQKVEEYYTGEKAFSKKSAVLLNYPVVRGFVSCWDDMENLWKYIYKHELKVKASERPVLLSEPPLNPLQNRERTTEVMFERFNVPALYLSVQATLALYASARTTGLVMDSGDGVTHAVPIYDGYCLPHGVSRLDVAGKDVTNYLASLLLGNSHNSLSRAKKIVVKDIKEKFCYVALDPKQEAERKADKVLKLPDGSAVKINHHLCQAPEILFAPKTIGIEAPGIQDMITKSIRKCDRDICEPLYGNMVLSGGSSLFQGLDERIFKEIEQQVPQGVPVRIIAPPERTCAAWLGGSIITHLVSFVPMWITCEDYREFGAAGIHRKCF
ncbi:actin-related protein T2-like isoform X2 [Rhineura floridana]|uniref:actin-related protein T2-like isoform X2 n=1 Tax=Rhineura floridana TaxID=261503 RepID=UPI002AC87B3A|nr:actin-related protein T2-like isoform X2 [Rhineura floridana]